MKFMKLGSKPDQFQTDGDNIRYVASDLATDIIINVGDVKFYLHKFPLLSKSCHLQKLDGNDEINLDDIPGGPSVFEICAKFCYGMAVTLNAYNVVSARCAAEYLQMYETIEKGNLVHKIDVFLSSTIFRSWKDSIIVLHTTKCHLPWSEELKIVSRCIDSIASKASIDPLKVNWSYTYKNSLPHQRHAVPQDWWVEDICQLQIDVYKRILSRIQAEGKASSEAVGESLKAYALRRLPGLSKGKVEGDNVKHRYLVGTITKLLISTEKSSVSSSFLLKLLQASLMLGCSEMTSSSLMQKIACQLDEATLDDLLIRSETGEMALYNINIVMDLVEHFMIQDDGEVSKMKVARLVDSYLAEAARDSSLPLSKFVDLAMMLSTFPRSTHDGIYRAIDMYLKEHPGMSKSERKKICGLMDCRKLSSEACGHAVQNERLPLRVIMQVLFMEQGRAGSSSSLPNLRGLAPGGSYGSSRSATTNTDDELWDGDQTAQEVESLKLELASLRLRHNGPSGNAVSTPSGRRGRSSS